MAFSDFKSRKCKKLQKYQPFVIGYCDDLMKIDEIIEFGLVNYY